MRAAAVVVVRIRGEDAMQMALVEDYYVAEALAAKRTDDAFDICISAKMIARADNVGDPT
jgi:hypothetical protein